MAERRTPCLERTRLGLGAVIADSTFLVCVAFSTAVLWVSRAGFSSDDWNLLRIFRFAPDQSLLGLYRMVSAALPANRMRPTQLLYLAASYKLWGLHPLGYHVVNVIVLSAIGILLWALLRELGQPRVWALASAVVYLTLPNYTTARFWVAAYSSTLSIALYLLSFYADLRSLRADGRGVWGWRALGVASLISCVMAYEVALPLFAINLVVVLFLGRTDARSGLFKRARMTAALETAALLGVTVFKVAAKTRDGIDGAYIPYVVGLVKDALIVHWRGYGLGLPLRVWRAANRYPDTRILAVSIALALAVATYLWWISDRHKVAWPTYRYGLAWFFVGALAFALGHAIFLVTEATVRGGLTMTGKSNRVAVAATIGVTLCFVAGAGCLVGLIPAAKRGAAFATWIGLLAAGGFIIDNAVANCWAGAYQKQMSALAAIQKRFPRLPPHSTLILDGVCPYVGPAVVFKSKWDLAGLLALTYNDPTLRADVVSREMFVRTDGLATKTHSDQSFYPFSNDLIVFDPRSGSVFPLPDHAAAQGYFERQREAWCPRQEIF
jgi:hypothetical protein